MNRYRFFESMDLDKIEEYKIQEKEKYEKRSIPFERLEILDKKSKNIIIAFKKEDFKNYKEYFDAFVDVLDKNGYDKIEIICDGLKVEHFLASHDPLGPEIIFEFETSLVKFKEAVSIYCQKSKHKELGDKIILQDQKDNKIYGLNGKKTIDESHPTNVLFDHKPIKLFIFED